MLLLLVVLGSMVYWIGSRFISITWGLRWTLCLLVGGLLAYSYLAARLPGAPAFLKMGGWPGMMGVVLLGAALGLGAGVLWHRLPTGSAKRSG